MVRKIKVPREFWDDAEWAEKHYSELQRKFSDKWIAVVNKKVVSSGTNIRRVEEEAEKITKKSRNQIPVLFVECGAHVY